MKAYALLRKVPFLKKGTFNGKFKVDDSVMDSILDEFRNHDRDNPQIFIGHNSKKEEYETNGVITSIYKDKYKEQDTLFYDAEIDETLFNYLKQKKLTRCSGEFYLSNLDEVNNSKASPKWYLGGMAVLGRSSSAVDIAKISEENLVINNKEAYLNQAIKLSDSGGFEASFDFLGAEFLVEKGGNKMTQEEIESLVNEKIISQNLEIQGIKELLEKQTKEFNLLKEVLNTKNSEIEAMHKENIALKDSLEDMGKRLSSSANIFDLFNKNIELLSSKVTSPKEKVFTTKEEASKEIKKYAEENNMKYSEALFALSKSNKSLERMMEE